MASTEAPPRAHDRHGRRKPFASWMKRLANLKTLHVDPNNSVMPRRSNGQMTTKSKKSNISKNNPYPLSSRVDSHSMGHLSFSTPLSSQRSRHSSMSQSKHSISMSHDSQAAPKSRAPTLGTTAETAISDAAPSGAGTIGTTARTEGDHNSTFSSPAPSLRSMTTTLTTVQSTATPLTNAPQANGVQQQSGGFTTSPFSVQPATAVPPHLNPHSHLTTYNTATANNVLTDDASILTLASSSKRRRRNSLDTNASVRALAPASVFGGSRESLPLSVLSGTIIHPGADSASIRETSGSTNPRNTLNAERASLISASGVTAPVLASERNSYIGSKYGDAASVRSGLLGPGHGRTESISGSIGGRDHKEKDILSTSPLVDSAPIHSYSSATADRNRSPSAINFDHGERHMDETAEEEADII